MPEALIDSKKDYHSIKEAHSLTTDRFDNSMQLPMIDLPKESWEFIN